MDKFFKRKADQKSEDSVDKDIYERKRKCRKCDQDKTLKGSEMSTEIDDTGLLVSGICKFSLALYMKQAKETGGNIFLSPLSISAVLNMALLGAKGQTLEEMKTSLFLSTFDDAKLHKAFSDLIAHMKKCSSEVNQKTKEPFFHLFMANRLYAEKSCHILEDFQMACKKYYNSELAPVDFIGNAEKTAEEINDWVSECTNQKIKDVISKNFINGLTRLILVNAIYFKSAWEYPFKKRDTRDTDFFVSSQETVKIQMMFQKIESARYYHSSALQCKVIQLPYLSGKLSMFVLLPDEMSSLDILESKLSADDIEGFDKLFQQYLNVKLWLPKFKIEETLELTEILRSMGMKSLFSAREADLSGIDGARNLYASKVVHKAFVDVNEEGTEAAASTALCLSARRRKEFVDFRADRPFLFFIREEDAKMILFIGRVMKP